MNLDKSDLKIQTANELGCRLDDLLEGSQKELYRLEGSVTSFKKSMTSIEDLEKVVDKEMDEGKFDLEVATHIKRFTDRARQMLLNMALNAENLRLMQLGKIQAYEHSVSSTKKFVTDEASRAAQLREAVEAARKAQANSTNGAPVSAEIDDPRRPPPSIKVQRLAEEAAAAAAVPAAAEKASKKEEAPTKKRGRPPKKR